jgi:hypothetical protein
VVAHHTVTEGSGAEARAPDTVLPVAGTGTPGRTIDRAPDKAGSIVGKAAVVAGKAAAMLVVYSALPQTLPPLEI